MAAHAVVRAGARLAHARSASRGGLQRGRGGRAAGGAGRGVTPQREARLRIHGRVQGVGFRWHARQPATSAAVSARAPASRRPSR
ncbi:MAG: acylphosphatase [Armatimonadetes bacterium]|nr:acylphosphatase [Armatimonadota bacterium]